jgi:hypothetical protein
MELPEPVDLRAKLYRLKDCLDDLDPDDQQFVNAMVKRLERGETPYLPQVLRIKDMQVPGETPLVDPIQRAGTVTALRKDLDQVILRYMPLEQLVFLLSTGTLHFSPLCCMTDTSEGQLPQRAFEQTKAMLPPHFSEPGATIDADTMTTLSIRYRRRDACISCWYLDDLDNIAMWDAYARNRVAIRTTVRRLHSSLNGCYDTNVHMDRVIYYEPNEEERYIDDAYFGWLFIKHAEGFRHEKEFRALARRTNDGRGVNIPIASNVLIESLILSPDLPDWAAPFIIELISTLGFAGQIDRSLAKSSRVAILDVKSLIATLRDGQVKSSGWYEGNSSREVRDLIETVIRKMQESDTIPEWRLWRRQVTWSDDHEDGPVWFGAALS